MWQASTEALYAKDCRTFCSVKHVRLWSNKQFFKCWWACGLSSKDTPLSSWRHFQHLSTIDKTCNNCNAIKTTRNKRGNEQARQDPERTLVNYTPGFSVSLKGSTSTSSTASNETAYVYDTSPKLNGSHLLPVLSSSSGNSETFT